MDIFCCDDCGVVDAVDLAYPGGSLQDGKSRTHWQCTQCQRRDWHGFFDREKYRPDFDVVVNRPSGIGMG